MAEFMARRIENACDENGVEAGKEKYRVYFVKTKIYIKKYKDDVDTILRTDGYEDCIVTN